MNLLDIGESKGEKMMEWTDTQLMPAPSKHIDYSVQFSYHAFQDPN